LLPNKSVPCVGDYTLYQLKVLWAEAHKLENIKKANMSEAMRYGQNASAEEYKKYIKDLTTNV